MTQAAIRAYQATQQLPQDGFASPSLYQRLLMPSLVAPQTATLE